MIKKYHLESPRPGSKVIASVHNSREAALTRRCRPRISASLEVVYFIKHAPKNYLRPLSGAQTFQTLFQHSLIPYWDEKGMNEVLNSFEWLTQEIPAYELGVVPERHIVEFVTSGL